MVGSVPPSSMHSMSSSVIAARMARSATDSPEGSADVVEGLAEGQCLADRDPFGIVGHLLAACQRVW